MSQTVLDSFIEPLSYTPDDFQLTACRSLEDGRGVLVCAPTGAGKTFVGEFAIHLAHSQGTKCFYTTPIKALSNQKYADLVEVYGDDEVGLLTGDVSINGNADIVVMTTEVLRNMIYAQSETLQRLSHVVMDEIHYLADRDRGAVWEEVILGLHEDIRVVGLSATVSNSEEFARWLTTVRGDTDIVVTDHRPVPLNQFMLVGNRMLPLFEKGGQKVNRELLDVCASAEERRVRFARRPDVVKLLENRDMLPAIIFIFSRAGCEGALAQMGSSKFDLTDSDERERIDAIIDAGIDGIPRADLDVLDFYRWRNIVRRGFAAHHAGMLPAFRHIVEKLFNAGLVKVVFATETLALGINMPARSVMMERLVKYDGEAHVDLTPGQYTQMTGRAGRRGIDTIGNAVVQWTQAMDPRWVAGLASTRTYPLNSTFTPGYNMAVNLLRNGGYLESKTTLEKSFAQFQSDGDVVSSVRALEKAQERVDALTTTIGADPDGLDSLMEYLDLREAITAEERRAKRHAIEDRFEQSVVALRRLRRGEVVAMPRGKKIERVAVVREDSSGPNPRPLVVGAGGFTGRIDAGMFPSAPVVLGRIRIPADAGRRPKRAIGLIQSEMDRQDIRGPKRLKKATSKPSAKLKGLKKDLRQHPLHGDPSIDAAAKSMRELRSARAEVVKLQGTIEKASDTLARTFDRILDLLQEMDYVEKTGTDQWHVTEEGDRLARIHNSSDLLVATCLRRGIWDDLDPAELAGAVSTLVFENRRETPGTDVVPTENLSTAISHVMRIWDELTEDEQRHRLPLTRVPDTSFAAAIHQWAAGAPLAYALGAAAENGAELTAGDFVRWCRQVIDLLDQVRATAYSDEVRTNARKASRAIRRGVVAIGQ